MCGGPKPSTGDIATALPGNKKAPTVLEDDQGLRVWKGHLAVTLLVIMPLAANVMK